MIRPILLKWQEDLGIASELLVFTVDHALRPYLRMLAQPYHHEFSQEEIGFWSQAAFVPSVAANRILAECAKQTASA
jgi:hypothetical protein